MSTIHIPTPLRQYVGKEHTVDVKGATVGEAMNALVALYPDVRRHLYTEDGKLRSFVNLYVNDEDIRYLQKEDTAVKEGDSISIVPSIAGGADPQFCRPDSFVIPSEARDLVSACSPRGLCGSSGNQGPSLRSGRQLFTRDD